MERPNIFNYATSELSQDAFISWLLSWGNYPENVELNKTAKYLIEKLTDNQIRKIEKIEIVKQQRYKIDILCIVNDEYAILIEDKTNTKNHSNQLENYLTKLSKDFPREKIFPIYFKTGDQSNFASINKAGYKLFLRSNFIEVLDFGKNQGIRNSTYLDFYDYLIRIENSVQSFKTLPVKNWHWDSWKGFYIELQKRLGQGDWDYVPQKNGGFLGFWWYGHYKEFENTGFDYYLMIEHEKFCFKIYPYDVNLNYEIREYYRNLLFQKSFEYGIKIKRNGRCIKGKTKTLTVAKLENNYLKTHLNGFIDIEQTVQGIKKIENMIKEV